MRRNRAAVLAGGGLIALQTGLAFGLSSAAPLLGVFQPFDPVLGVRTEPLLGTVRLLGGFPGGFLAGFASRNEQGDPDAVRGLLAGATAGVVGLFFAYVVYLLVVALATLSGQALPLSPLYLATLVPLALGAPLLATVPIGGLLAGGAGALAADPATDLRALLRPADREPDAEPREERPAVPDRVERLVERAVYAPDEADFDELVSVLDRPEPTIRAAAVRALASVPRSHLDRVTDAAPALVDLLDAEERAVRHAAAESLSRIAGVAPRTVATHADRLAAHLPDADVRVRNHLADALCHVAAAEPDRATVVLDLLEADDPAVRGAAISVLASAPSAAAPALDRLVALFEGSAHNRDEIAPLLAAAAREEPGAVAPAVPALVEYIEDDPGDREAAIEALARIAVDDPGAARPGVGALAEALGHAEGSRRETIAAGVVSVLEAFPDAGGTVEAALSAGDSWQRYDAERALEEAVDGADLEELLGR